MEDERELKGGSRVKAALIGGAAVALVGGALLFHRAAGATNQVALAAQPKGVTAAPARAASYRPTRRYVATIEPWIRADIGTQLVSAYVDTVLVRPGDRVKRGDVLATLDCRNASAESSAVAMRARALEARQVALAKESARIAGLLDGGFVAPNEVDQKAAESASMDAQLLGAKAQLLGRSLEVNDCVLKAPFDGEIAERMIDPGAFVRPGRALVSLIDRAALRVVADVPEGDTAAVAAGTAVRLRMLATGQESAGQITRRAPAADPATRTVHIEIDLADPSRGVPVGTTAEIKLDVGAPLPAAQIPLSAAQVRGAKATLFVVTDGHARLVTARVLGEGGGRLFLDPASLAPGSVVVTEGRALLGDGDAVQVKLAPIEDEPAPAVEPRRTP